MSSPAVPTFEQMMTLFHETREQIHALREQMKETSHQMSEQMKETNRQMKETDKKISALGSRIGEIVENMVAGNILEKFQALGYDVTGCSPRKTFKNKKLGITGEIDLCLDDGPVAILIEVKTALETADVRQHLAKMEKYRQYIDARGIGNKQHLIGAVAGAVVHGDAVTFAQENGLYVIVQTGEPVEIVTPPEGFVAREW